MLQEKAVTVWGVLTQTVQGRLGAPEIKREENGFVERTRLVFAKGFVQLLVHLLLHSPSIVAGQNLPPADKSGIKEAVRSVTGLEFQSPSVCLSAMDTVEDLLSSLPRNAGLLLSD